MHFPAPRPRPDGLVRGRERRIRLRRLPPPLHKSSAALACSQKTPWHAPLFDPMRRLVWRKLKSQTIPFAASTAAHHKDVQQKNTIKDRLTFQVPGHRLGLHVIASEHRMGRARKCDPRIDDSAIQISRNKIDAGSISGSSPRTRMTSSKKVIPARKTSLTLHASWLVPAPHS